MSYRIRSLVGLMLGSLFTASTLGCGGVNIGPGDYVVFRTAFAIPEKNAACYPDKEIPIEDKDDTSTIREPATLILYQGPEDLFYLDTDEAVLSGTLEDDLFTFTGEIVDIEYKNGKPAEMMRDADHDGLEDSKDTDIDADKDGLNDKDNFTDEEVDTDKDGVDDRDFDNDVDVDRDGKDDRFTIVKEALDGDKYTTTVSTKVAFTVSNDSVAGTRSVVVKQVCAGEKCPVAETLPNCTTDTKFVGTRVNDAAIEHQL